MDSILDPSHDEEENQGPATALSDTALPSTPVVEEKQKTDFGALLDQTVSEMTSEVTNLNAFQV